MFKRILAKVYYCISIIYRNALTMTFGAIICKPAFLSRYKIYLLSTWHDFDKRRGADNFLFYPVFNFWIKFEYLREEDPDKRESLKGLAMGGSSGREWAKDYDSKPLDFDSKIGDMTLNKTVPMFKEIENILKTIETKLFVIQVGSSSGREIAYFANRYPTHTYIGTDIYQEVVDFSSHSHKSANLSFRELSAKNISMLLSEYRNESILIFSRGSLQYVQPEHLPPFFDSIANYASAKVLLNEPGSESQGKVDELRGSIWRGNFSYTHNYKYYAERAGIETIKSKVIRPYLSANRVLDSRYFTVNYFYYGRTNSCHW